MGENMTMERIDAAGRGPGVKREVIGPSRHYRHGIKLLRLRQQMPVLGDQVEEATVQMHGMRHRDIRSKEAQMHRLSMLHQDRLGIRKTLAIDHIIVAQHADKLIVGDIGFDRLGGLRGARTRIDQKCAIETAALLLHVIIMAMILVGPDIIVGNGEIIGIGLPWLNGLHAAQARHAVLATGHLQSMPVNGRRRG